MLVVVLVAGLFAGLVSGVAGMGVAIAALPVLLYGPELFGIEPLSVKEVTGLTVVQSFASGAVNIVRHRSAGYVHRPLVLWVGLPAGALALGGALASTFLPDAAILATMVGMALAAAAVMLSPSILRGRASGPGDDGWSGESEPPDVDRVRALTVGAVVGGVGGISGLPGAFLMVPLLIFGLGIPTRLAIGSNLGIMLFASGAAFIGKLGGTLVPAVPALVIVGSTMVATLLGFEINRRLSARHLRWLLGALVAATAVRVLLDLLG
ncbi:MAG: sulfite exporter TauE/SafE family protein [Dehalococcoidia bacterium]|nr:sulfite exporter TauE/SafE family protein [Dehalococcoidia bacterium]